MFQQFLLSFLVMGSRTGKTGGRREQKELGRRRRWWLLTVGDGQQGAVRCVHVARSHVVPLRRPVDGGVVLNIKLLHRDRQAKFSAYCS